MLDDQAKCDVQLRKDQRLAVAFALTYRIDGNPVVRAGRAHDIGGGGIAFETDVSLPEGARTELGFELLQGSKIAVRGKITASHLDCANGMYLNRVAFEGISSDVRDSIRAFVFEALRTALMNHLPDEHPKSAVHLRGYQRLNLRFRLTYSVEGDSAVRLGQARDISAGGIHFDSEEAIAEDAHVQMEFELRPDLRIAVRGKLDTRQSIRAFVYEALRCSLFR